MNKQEARVQNLEAVMFCQEGGFFTFYDVDALIVNDLCGYKLIASGQRPKAGVPLKNTAIFERLEKDCISYFVFKRDDGIIKRFDALGNGYKNKCNQLIDALTKNHKSVETFFPKAAKTKSLTALSAVSESVGLEEACDKASAQAADIPKQSDKGRSESVVVKFEHKIVCKLDSIIAELEAVSGVSIDIIKRLREFNQKIMELFAVFCLGDC